LRRATRPVRGRVTGCGSAGRRRGARGRRPALAPLAAALALVSGLAAAGDLAEPSGPRAAVERFVAAFNALDWEAFRASFDDEASLFNPDVAGVGSLHRLDGRAEIERSFHAFFGAPSGPGIVPEHVRVQQFADTAVVTFEFRRPGSSFGRRTVVLHRTERGWRIVHLHASNAGS
jgi:ketosteroid isomerase-like protein